MQVIRGAMRPSRLRKKTYYAATPVPIGQLTPVPPSPQ